MLMDPSSDSTGASTPAGNSGKLQGRPRPAHHLRGCSCPTPLCLARSVPWLAHPLHRRRRGSHQWHQPDAQRRRRGHAQRGQRVPRSGQACVDSQRSESAAAHSPHHRATLPCCWCHRLTAGHCSNLHGKHLQLFHAAARLRLDRAGSPSSAAGPLGHPRAPSAVSSCGWPPRSWRLCRKVPASWRQKKSALPAGHQRPGLRRSHRPWPQRVADHRKPVAAAWPQRQWGFPTMAPSRERAGRGKTLKAPPRGTINGPRAEARSDLS
mmetsp:Transcript_33607/g.85102  ORF Transcript_33607/g.85102 Transcript_33607/m.85102 type:complete len:266 (+) Transcript_33607:707-1504(+)